MTFVRGSVRCLSSLVVVFRVAFKVPHAFLFVTRHIVEGRPYLRLLVPKSNSDLFLCRLHFGHELEIKPTRLLRLSLHPAVRPTTTLQMMVCQVQSITDCHLFLDVVTFAFAF